MSLHLVQFLFSFPCYNTTTILNTCRHYEKTDLNASFIVLTFWVYSNCLIDSFLYNVALDINCYNFIFVKMCRFSFLHGGAVVQSVERATPGQEIVD